MASEAKLISSKHMYSNVETKCSCWELGPICFRREIPIITRDYIEKEGTNISPPIVSTTYGKSHPLYESV